MTLAELVAQIKSAELHPIQVEEDHDRIEDGGLHLVGTLDDFLLAAKVLNAKAIFFCAFELEDEDFFTGEESNTGDLEEELDLIQGNPELVKYKKHVGEICMFVLSAKTQTATITFELDEPWWIDFQGASALAIETLGERQSDLTEKNEEERRRNEDALCKQLQQLIDDPQFGSIPTQRGMKDYALEKIPSLENIDANRLKIEIQKLDDKLSRKRKRR